MTDRPTTWTAPQIWAGRIAILVVFFSLWERAAASKFIDPILIGRPSGVATFLWQEIFITGSLIKDLGWTMLGTILAFLLGSVCGVLLGMVFVTRPTVEALLSPILMALNAMPRIALAPLFLIWFGTGAQPKIAIAFLIAVFAVVIDTALGLQSVSPETLDLARTLRGSRLKVLLRIKMYCALPHVFAGLKVAMSLALVGAIVGEFVSSQRGLGYVILTAQGTFDTPRVFAAIAILAALGVALIALIEKIERISLPWYQASKRQAVH